MCSKQIKYDNLVSKSRQSLITRFITPYFMTRVCTINSLSYLYQGHQAHEFPSLPTTRKVKGYW